MKKNAPGDDNDEEDDNDLELIEEEKKNELPIIFHEREIMESIEN
jgi:hypothetical protein